MKAGSYPLPAFINFFIDAFLQTRIRRRIGQAAACKAVTLREYEGSSPS